MMLQSIPKLADAHYVPDIAYNEDKVTRTIADFVIAVELDTKPASIYNNQGITYCKNRDYDQGIVYFIKAVELHPEYAVAYFNRGNALKCHRLFRPQN